MRLAVVEKKTASKYGERDEETEEREQDEEAAEDSPLLGNGNQKEAEQWKIPEDQPKMVRKFPIFYCLGEPRLLVAESVAFTQATLLAAFDATIPIEAQDLFGFDSLSTGLLFALLVIPYLKL